MVLVDDTPSPKAARTWGTDLRGHGDVRVSNVIKAQRSTRPGLAAYLPPTRDEVEEISVAFSVFQKDEEGRMDYHEVKSALRAMGFAVRKGELLQILTQCCEDAEELGVSKHEFSSVAMRFISRRTPAEELERDFAIFDTKKKGYIDIGDVRRVSRLVGGTKRSDGDLVAMMSHFDSNRDGRMTLENFVEALGRSHRL